MPSSGLKPIVVSTDRPSATAVTEQPPPRWQTTRRRAAHPLGRPLHREAVEAVAADAPLLAPAVRHGVRGRVRGHRGVERRVEDGDVRHAGQRLPGGGDRRERRAVVQRRELDELLERARPPVVDQDGRDEARAAVDDAVGDGVDVARGLLERLDGYRRVVLVDDAELEARRAGVDDEDPDGHRLRTARSSRGSPDRPRRARACRRGRAAGRRPSPGAGAPPSSTSPGTRSITSMTRWKRSRSFSITMSNGVVVVPSSL